MKKLAKAYDIHCHLMNLSHPDFIALLNRVYGEFAPKRVGMPLVFQFLAILTFFSEMDRGRILSWMLRKSGAAGLKERVVNLFSFMENDVFHMLKLIEEDLKSHLRPLPFDRLVMTPLIMDFGNREEGKSPQLYRRRNKPVWEQAADLADGIRLYCERVKEPILQIYPFFGLNPANYSTKRLEQTVYRLFGEYRGDESLFAREMCRFQGNPEDMGSNIFAGVKLYPPLQCDPWPDQERERAKWKIFYSLAEKRQVPITVHCSEGGYRTIPRETARIYTEPRRWQPVLERYPKLKLNFAHFGRGAEKWKWDEEILDLIATYPNVYADFSNRGVNRKEYEKICRIVEKGQREKVARRLLFGSDFMINLLWLESYSQYFALFFRDEIFSSCHKRLFIYDNPQRFLFLKPEKIAPRQ